jgi:hypothetical protein
MVTSDLLVSYKIVAPMRYRLNLSLVSNELMSCARKGPLLRVPFLQTKNQNKILYSIINLSDWYSVIYGEHNALSQLK